MKNMKKEEFQKGCFRLIADEGYIVQSKAMHYDEESGQDVPDIIGEKVYLGKNDSEDNYVAITKEEE